MARPWFLVSLPTTHAFFLSPSPLVKVITKTYPSPLASPGLTQGTLVVYAYAVGSLFDFQMNYYMSTPSAIDPSTLQAHYLAVNGNFTIPLVDTSPALAVDVA